MALVEENLIERKTFLVKAVRLLFLEHQVLVRFFIWETVQSKVVNLSDRLL